MPGTYSPGAVLLWGARAVVTGNDGCASVVGVQKCVGGEHIIEAYEQKYGDYM